MLCDRQGLTHVGGLHYRRTSLFGMDSAAALATWDDATGKGAPAVAKIEWADTRPAVFFVFDAESRLHVWDLLAHDSVPVFTQQLLPAGSAPSGLAITSYVVRVAPTAHWLRWLRRLSSRAACRVVACGCGLAALSRTQVEACEDAATSRGRAGSGRRSERAGVGQGTCGARGR